MQKLGANPWVTIWSNPRRTIRALVDFEPKKGFFILATLFALTSFFDFSGYTSYESAYSFVFSLIIGLLLSPVIGAVWFYFFGWILHFTGRWLKGSAPALHLRVVFAWSKVPLLIPFLMWFVLLVFAHDYIIMRRSNPTAFTFINIISTISWFWSLVILIQGIKEVQRFSLLRSIGNVVLAYVSLFLLIFVVFLCAGAFAHFLS